MNTIPSFAQQMLEIAKKNKDTKTMTLAAEIAAFESKSKEPVQPSK